MDEKGPCPAALLGDTERSWVVDAVSASNDGIYIVGRDGLLIYANEAATDLIGPVHERSTPIEWPAAYGIFFSDERTVYPFDQVPLTRALRGEVVRDAALFIRNHAIPAGVHLHVSAFPLRDGAGGLRGGACFFRDISERVADARRLRESVRQKKAILDNIPDMAWLKDEESRYVLVNQRLADSVGKTRPDDIVGLTDLDIFPRELAERYRSDDADVMRTGGHKRVEEPFVDATGRHQWLETLKTPIYDDTGKVIGTTGISRDVTERLAAEQRLRSLNDELERRVSERTAELAEAQESLVRQERLAVLGQLAGGVAHQIRNPLAAIMNASYVLKRHLAPEQHPNVDDAIRIIHDEVRHANIIITGLLDYARMRTPDRHPTSIVSLLERILEVDWIPTNIEVVRHLPATQEIVCDVDADQLGAAISNLVRNAVEAMPTGGRLDVGLNVHDREVVITVADTGVGISPQLRAHLFEPLHSTKPLGIGLGLVTARRLVEAHDGRIAVLEVPHGACFEVRLPLSSAPSSR